MKEDYSKYPCGADGLSFPNGLPKPNTKVMVRTVWERDWSEKYFMEKYSWERQYCWFSVYAKPCVEEGSMPIVLEWKYVCPDCGEVVDEDGETLEYIECGYCFVSCETCGDHCCDQSC